MLTFLNFILLFCYHTFYVSLCEVRFVEDKSIIQVSWKFFPDDIEEAIRPVEAESFYLNHRNFNTDSLLASYINKHFVCSLDKQQLKQEYVGFEIDGSDLWCYFQVPYQEVKDGEESINLTITALTELYPEQQNYIQVYRNDSLVDSQMLTEDKSRLLLDFK